MQFQQKHRHYYVNYDKINNTWCEDFYTWKQQNGKAQSQNDK